MNRYELLVFILHSFSLCSIHPTGTVDLDHSYLQWQIRMQRSQGYDLFPIEYVLLSSREKQNNIFVDRGR